MRSFALGRAPCRSCGLAGLRVGIGLVPGSNEGGESMKASLSLRGTGRAVGIALSGAVALWAAGLLVSCGPVVGHGSNNSTGDGGGTCQVGDIECVGMTARICQADGT